MGVEIWHHSEDLIVSQAAKSSNSNEGANRGTGSDRWTEFGLNMVHRNVVRLRNQMRQLRVEADAEQNGTGPGHEFYAGSGEVPIIVSLSSSKTDLALGIKAYPRNNNKIRGSERNEFMADGVWLGDAVATAAQFIGNRHQVKG